MLLNPTITRKCAHCGCLFTAKWKKRRKRLCSTKCRGLHRAKPLAERFWGFVKQDGPTVRSDLGPCWAWTGPCDKLGYGRIGYKDQEGRWKNMLSHRCSWELQVGPIPDGKCVLHRCDNPNCLRISHLFVDTQSANMADMLAKGRGKLRGHSELRHRGEQNVHSRLTEEDVRKIRELRKSGMLIRELKELYGHAISGVLYGHTWRHVV